MKKIDYKLLTISIGISAGLVLFVIGMSTGLTGRDASNLPEAIEQISPGQGDQVLQQSQIIVDFIEGYTATLTIDGIELPTTRLDEVVATGKQIAHHQCWYFCWARVIRNRYEHRSHWS